MEKLIKELKSKYSKIRYSNLINGRKNEWWFTISPQSFIHPIVLYLMLIDRKRNKITVLKIESKDLEGIIPRRENVYLAGQFDLYFSMDEFDTLNMKYLTETEHIEKDIKSNILEIRDTEAISKDTDSTFIENLDDLERNLVTMEAYIGEDFSTLEKDFALSLIQKGKNLIAYKVLDEIHFAPSRFIGYKENDIDKHLKNEEKDGKETTPIINKITKNKLQFDSEIEDIYVDYCKTLDIEIYHNKRKYWYLDLTGSSFDTIANNYSKGYLEGRTFEGKHKRRERNRKLVDDAKRRFRDEHEGQIFCEICRFNFMTNYGVDYIEVHHLKAISNMKEDEATCLDDVCLVCPNCHRVIHSKYPHLTLEQVRALLDNKKNEL
mgnify:CR=1 FL=1